MIHTSLSPNTEADDVHLSVKLLFTPWTWNNHKNVTEAERMLADTLGMSHVTTVDSGRTAFYTILKALQVGAGDDVIVQAYTCVAVPDPVLWVGARPVYVDCTNDLTMDLADLQKKITPRTKVIVVQHTFGMPARIKEIIAIAREKNIFVIEDCAHALGGDIDGQPLGSFADASFFSFGRDKSVSSVFGGAIATESAELFEKIQKITATYPKPSMVWVKRQILHPIVLSISKATYSIYFGKLFLEAAKRVHLISKAVEKTELSGGRPTFTLHRYSPALAVLLIHQLKKLPRFVAHRKECAQLYDMGLRVADSSSVSCEVPSGAPGNAYLRYTLFSPNPKAIFKKAREKGIYLGDWYTTVLAPKGVNYAAVGYTEGSCPNAERLARETLNLPTHIGITPAMIQTIIHDIFN